MYLGKEEIEKGKAPKLQKQYLEYLGRKRTKKIEYSISI